MGYTPKSNYEHVLEQRERDFEATAQYKRILSSLYITVRLDKESQVIVTHNGNDFPNHQVAVDVLFVMLGGEYDSTAIRQMNNHLAFSVSLGLPDSNEVRLAISQAEKLLLQ